MLRSDLIFIFLIMCHI